MITMTRVATLICNPNAPALDDAKLKRAQAELREAGAPQWLAPSIAADIPFTAAGEHERTVAERLRGLLAGASIDIVVQPLAARRKKLFVADMDSTMIAQECIDELADYAGMKADVAAITERAMRGEITFEPALRERVALLKGLPASIVETIVAERIALTPGARTLVATMRANGAHTCLVSGGFTLFTNRIAAMIGFNESRANTLGVDGEGKLTGEVEAPILGREAKVKALRDLIQRLKLRREDTLAAGDGANDIPMIEAAGLGVAYRGKPAVAAAAHARIDYGDLTALLYLQGYRREEFAEI